MKSVNQIHLASSPIPIPMSYNNNKRNYRCSATKNIKHCNCSPIQSPQTKSFTESNMKKQIASSAPVLIDFDKEADIVTFNDETDDNDFYAQSCPSSNTIINASSVHLVNGLNIEQNIKNVDEFYVLCDCPKIKDISNTLSYHILDSKKGIFAFINQQHIEVLKRYLQLPYYVVKINRKDLIHYNKTTKTSSIVLYNSYTDVESKSSYFLYYSLNIE
jgi:hypothetical protein